MSDEWWVMSDEWWVIEIEWRKLSDEKSLSKQALRIRLDTTENRKYYNKIIFKCVNSTVGPIFNENVIEK